MSLLGYSPWDHKELDTTEQLNQYTVNRNTFTSGFGGKTLCFGPARMVCTRPLGLFPPSCSSAVGHLLLKCDLRMSGKITRMISRPGGPVQLLTSWPASCLLPRSQGTWMFLYLPLVAWETFLLCCLVSQWLIILKKKKKPSPQKISADLGNHSHCPKFFLKCLSNLL